MRDLFSDRRHAFFAQAKPVELPRLQPEGLAEYVGARFEAGGRDPGEALEPLLQTADGHPQRAMLLAHHLYEQTAPAAVAGGEEWVRTFAAAAHDANPEVQAAWESWNNSERRLMAVIAQRSMPLQGRAARERYGISKTGGNQNTLNRLQRDGHIVADETAATGWRVVDPLLERWLAGDRSWPAST